MPPALLGRTPAMTAVYKQIAHAASADAPVLIIGESGTGKELVARAIHQHGNRSGRPFVPINCGALTETLLESELFGHVKGSFTGAVSRHEGRVPDRPHRHRLSRRSRRDVAGAAGQAAARAAGGRSARRSARAARSKSTCASSRPPTSTSRRAVAEGKFRQDLFYRLGVVIINLPPLRERRDDIPLLVERFLQGGVRRRPASRSS